MAFGPPFSISFDGLTPHPHHTTTTFLTKLLVYFLVSFFFFVVFFSGDFSEPETRVPFPECALKSVDAACAMVPGTLGERLRAKGSVLEAKQNPARFKDRHFRRDALSGLERCAGEVVAEMCEVVELEEDLEAGQLRLCLELFPLFADLFNQIDAEDNQYAAMVKTNTHTRTHTHTGHTGPQRKTCTVAPKGSEVTRCAEVATQPSLSKLRLDKHGWGRGRA
mmetsp:Transcript_14755/g.34758  ORF Transcript_14755/g.34758 Transcript_14755/m.34758 type:complete len:222 (+) Transcript_14755:134-799(+)